MTKLYFANASEFDIRAMLTFGVSAKEKDDAIGYFGTGFKYAVAIILRLGGKISVRSADNIYEFTASREEIRGKEFEIVKMNGNDAGFTTRLGINWQPWQALRELWCNCKDEGGEIGTAVSGEATTVVTVECDEIMRAYSEHANYFLPEGTPIVANEWADIYDRKSRFIFYRGVAIADTGEHEAEFTYNIKVSLELTEDRTLKHSFYANWYVSKALQSCKNIEFINRLLSFGRKTFEAHIDFDADWQTSKEFLDVAREFADSGRHLNESARRVLAKHTPITETFVDVGLTKVQFEMLVRAKAFLKKIGIDAERYPIRTVDGLGAGCFGRALEGTVFIAPLAFNQGTKLVASTLLEEWVHLEHKVHDFDRGMQNWLFEKVLSLGEEIAGEPI